MTASPSIKPDYQTVTESTGHKVTREAASMLLTRYAFARQFGEGKDVLEVACGSGHGLGYLSANARTVAGGDYSKELLGQGARHYAGRIPLLRLDGHALPFRDGSFDVVLLFEAIYYLHDPHKFFQESVRVLRPGGRLVICSANRLWSGFNPSPHSFRYFSSEELRDLLDKHRFQGEIFGGFPTQQAGLNSRLKGLVRILAAQFHLIPKTMKGKECLKRIFYGPLVVLGPEVTDALGTKGALALLSAGADSSGFKVLYASGQLSLER